MNEPSGGFPPIFLCDKTINKQNKERRELKSTNFISIHDMFKK